jgi:hypothetical protein
MVPPKISRPSNSLPKQKSAASRTKTRHRSRLGGLAHEMDNQLTVISLSCFKIRVATRNQTSSIVADIDRLETAVAEMTCLLDTLSELQKEMMPPLNPSSAKVLSITSSPSNKVYVLFDSNQKRS